MAHRGKDMNTTADLFRFTPMEDALLRAHPRVLLILLEIHDAYQEDANALWGDEEGCPKGHSTRRNALYERGRSILAEDLDIWPDDLRVAFGFPPYEAPNE
jgi:hypothetical protein